MYEYIFMLFNNNLTSLVARILTYPKKDLTPVIVC